MEGPTAAKELATFAENFAATEHGRYVSEPARFDERGVAWLPSAPPDLLPKAAAVQGMALLAALTWRLCSKVVTRPRITRLPRRAADTSGVREGPDI
jgi:hypothetical protein